ncbi:hypothetical protein N0V88_005062 [Collariella sp. IMI 366227]|nr:hypothetical protein N0V88_005062 [Collariella sp. IMI 366227]
MDSPSSNSLDKFLPKSIAEKRRRKKATSKAETSSTDDAPQRGSRPRSNPGSEASSLAGSMNSIEDQELSNRRPANISAHPSQIGYLTTSSPLVQAAHNPETLSSNTPDEASVRSSVLSQETPDGLDPALPLSRSRTVHEHPELRPQRTSSSTQLRDAFKLKKSPAKTPQRKLAAISNSEADRRNSDRRVSHGPKLDPLRPPQTPPGGDFSTPVITEGGLKRRPDQALHHHRPTLTPTPENGPMSPNPAATFFSSMFNAVQNTANSLTTTIPALGQNPGKNKPPQLNEPGEREPDTVEVESVAPQRPSTEPKEPAVKTLGMGDLSLSQLGIVETPSVAPSPVAARFIESETRRRSESAPPEPHAVGLDLLDTRPKSAHEPALGTLTPPAGSLYEGKGGIQRTGSIRSAIGHRRNRGSSVATHGTTATSTIGAAIAAAHSSIGNPVAGASTPKLTGFAVANKKRNRDFHALFKSVPDDDYLIEDYSCALQREILAHGRLYISEGHLCFSSNILGWVTTLVMSFDEIVSVEKRSTALVFKNGLEISTLHSKHVFASFASRDTTYDLIIKIWKLGHPQLQSSLNGVRLEEPGGDRTEKVDVETVSAAGTQSLTGTDDESEDGDDVYDEDEDEADGQAAGTPIDGQISDVMDKAATRKASGALVLSEKVEDGASAVGGDFPGPATHAPTDCGDAATHFEKVLGDDVIPAPLGKVYTMLFGPASAAWMGKWLTTDQKCTELTMEDKRGLTEEIRTRNYTYIKPLSGSIGPRQTKCIVTEQLESIDLEKAVNILVSTQNPDVPNGNIFTVKTKYCLSWAENNGTRVQINNLIEWSGKSWLKGAIERGANDGQAQYCKDLFAGLKAAVSSRTRTSTLNAVRAGGKKRARKNKSAIASAPTSDADTPQNPPTSKDLGHSNPPAPATSSTGYSSVFWLHHGSVSARGLRPRYSHDPAYADAPQRLAASVDPRTVGERVREERMDERELREAIRVTEEKLEVLKGVVERKEGR